MSEIPPPTIPPATPPPPGGGSYTPPPPPPPGGGYGPGPGTSGSSDRTLMIVLSYLGLLALIPYLTKKEDPEIMWHAKNGVGLLILDIVIMAVWWIIGFAVGNTVLGCGAGVIGCVIYLAIFALHVYCIIQAVGGKRPIIPVVTDFAQKSL
ncbi:MAG TPA: hypothetical protein VNI54_02520 [Thermoanaerobaculia bacterium]|nr:hypothetical protein [Thermoanaerobaculia bacterium]